jgi:hypothetical protein
MGLVSNACMAQPLRAADALLAIDQQRASVVERIVAKWGPTLAKSSDDVSIDDLRQRLMNLRADRLFAATLAGTEDGLREVTGLATAKPSLTRAAQTKALGDTATDVVYTPVTPCRLVDTRGTFAAVYQGNGTASHTPVPFASNETRTYTVQGGNGVCLTQLPGGLNPSAVQLQVFGMPTTNASGDIEILPQGATFGSTATMVYVASIAFNTVSTAAKINTANNEISVQVRGGGANVAIDVVGYFAAPSGNGGKFFMQGGNAFGTTALLGTVDGQPLEIYVNSQRVMRYEPRLDGPNILGGYQNNSVSGAVSGQTIGGGGTPGSSCFEPSTGTYVRSCANKTTNYYATVGGGMANQATGGAGVVSGGEENTASGPDATVPGGFGNAASNDSATVAGGFRNVASGGTSTVAGGAGNVASGDSSSVAGGDSNVASGNYASIPGGIQNVASGPISVAAGHNATADQGNCVVFGLWSSGNSSCLGTSNVFKVMGNNGFSVDYHQPVGGGGDRWLAIGPFTHGVVPTTIVTWNGAFLSDAGVWTNASSSRTRKKDFGAVDVDAVLNAVARLPITTWRYKEGDGDVLHMGPMAEDFWAAFGIGYGDRTIADLDARGVEFAAIQGLNVKVDRRNVAFEAELAEKDAKIDAQQREIDELRSELNAVKRAVERLVGGDARVVAN